MSGIIFVLRNGLRWRDAPKEYGPHKTIYNRFVRWSRLGVFNRIWAELNVQISQSGFQKLLVVAEHTSDRHGSGWYTNLVGLADVDQTAAPRRLSRSGSEGRS
jgi:transposase